LTKGGKEEKRKLAKFKSGGFLGLQRGEKQLYEQSTGGEGETNSVFLFFVHLY